MSFCHPLSVSLKQSVMGDASPRQFLCEWKSLGGHREDEDGLSSEDAALVRWRSVDRVAARKLRAEDEWSETTRACNTVDRPPNSSYKIGTVGSSATVGSATTVHATAAIRDRGEQIERVSGGIKRQRPQSACSAAARQRQLEQSHTAIEFEVRAAPTRAGRVRQRPQSARSRTSATNPRLDFPRGELADQLETSKWTCMLHRSPCFKQSSLQRLEAETYALLRFALGKTPSRGMTEAAASADVRHRKQQQANTSRRAGFDVNRPSSAKQRSNPSGDGILGVFSANAVVCGSGAQVVRSKKQQRQVYTTTRQSDGAASRSHRQDPQTELETSKDSLEYGSRIESPGSEDERRALREKTRLRSNDTKLKFKKKKRASPARKDPLHAASDDPPVIGRRTAARSYWTARASLALSVSTGGDSGRSPQMDEYVLAVTEPPDLPRATVDQQSAKFKKSTAAPKAPKEKMQTPAVSAIETRLHQKVSQPHCGARAIVTAKIPTNAKANCFIASEEHGQCEEPVAAERLRSLVGADTPTQSNRRNNRVTDESNTLDGANVIARSDEQQEGISTPAALSAELSGVSRSTFAAPVSPQIEQKCEVDELMQASESDLDRAVESVEREGKIIDLGGGSARETISTAFALFAETRSSDEVLAEGSQPSVANSGLHEVPSDPDTRIEATFSVRPFDASDSELRDISQVQEYGYCEPLEQNDMYADKSIISTEKHEPSNSMRDSTSDQVHSTNLLGDVTQSDNDDQDCRTEIIARLQTDAEKDTFLDQDARVDSSTGDNTMTLGTVSKLDAEQSEVGKLSEIGISVMNDTIVGLNNRVIAMFPEELPEPSVDVQGIDALGYRSISLRAFDESDDCQAVDAKPEVVEDRDHTLSILSEESVELVPALKAAFAGAADVCGYEDFGDCPGSRSNGLICNDMKSTQSAASGPINPITDDQSGEDTLSASTGLGTSCNNMGDSPITPHVEVPEVIMISSLLDSCANPIADSADLFGDAIPVLSHELSNDDEHVRLMHQSPADDSVVSLSGGAATIPQENAMAPTDTDDVRSIVTDPSKSFINDAYRTESSLSPCGEASAVGSEATLASSFDVFEQQFEWCNGENGDELLPDEGMPSTNESHSTAIVSIGESDTPCSDNPGVDTLAFISVDANEQLQSRLSGLESTLVDVADVYNPTLSDGRERSARLFDGAVSSDNKVPNAFNPGDCNVEVLDPVRGVLCEEMSQISIGSSNIRHPIMPSNGVDADGEVPSLPLINKQVSFVVEILDSRQSSENQRFATGCIDPMSGEPQPLDKSTLLLSESARRIQRQYRCFTARRLMLDQLQFFLKLQRRQARKRSKRESGRSSVVTIAHSSPSGSPLPPEEACIPESAEVAVANKPVLVGSDEIPSSPIDGAGAVTIVSEGHQTTPVNEDDVCAQTNSNPHFDISSDGIESNLDVDSNLDNAEPRQREEEARTHDDPALILTEADEVVRDGSTVETTKDLSPTVDTLSDEFDTSECREDPLDADDPQHYDNLGDLAVMRPSFDDQLSVSQLEDSAVNGDISPDEHTTLVEVICLGNVGEDGDAEIDSNDNEQEMDFAKESHDYPRESEGDAASDGSMIHEEQSDHVEQWERYMDAANNKSYYYNPMTGESRWTGPTDDRKADSDLGQELTPGATVIPDELEQEAENTVSTVEETEAPTCQTNWEVRRHSSHLGELRGEWQAFVDEGSQLTFYYNAATGESTWEAPAEFRIDDSSSLNDEVATTTAASTVDNYQWVLCVDPASGMTYYANLLTNETSWEKPQLSSEGAGSTSAPLVPIDLCGLAFEGDADAELVDLCGLAFDGDPELIGSGLIGDGDLHAPWAADAIGTAGDDESTETPYEEDYVIDFDDGTQV